MANIHSILPKMVTVSNNSVITNQVAIAINTKLSDKELADFKSWLQIIENNIQVVKNNSRKF